MKILKLTVAWSRDVIGAMEKGIEAAKVSTPPVGVYDGIDLKTLPKYICFKAALLKQKLHFQILLTILSAVFLVQFIYSRYEVSDLNEKLRRKEFILAPGVQNFVAASAQTVSDSYIAEAVSDFISQFGNISSENIDEQFERFSKSMSPDLRVRFLSESEGWKMKVKSEGLSEKVSVKSREIRSDEKGAYEVTAFVRTDSLLKGENLGFRDEVIEMSLKLVPPQEGRRWFLEMTSLAKTSEESYRVKQKLKGGNLK